MSVPMVSIGELAEKVTTWNPARSDRSEFDYIDLSSVDQEAKRISSTSRVASGEAPSRARQLVRKGDVLVSTVRPNLNGVANVLDEHDGMTASTGFCVLRPKARRLEGGYLFHWVTSPAFIRNMVQQATGASYPAVSDRIIKNSEIPLPPLDEQKRIAAILDKADALRRQRRRALTLLDSLTQSIFLEMFGDPVSNPKGIRKMALGDLIKVRSGNGLTSAEMDDDGGYPVYGGNGINGYHSEYMFDEPQIAIGRVGAYCGAVHITKPMAWVTDNALYVAERHSNLSINYLAEALRMANLNQYAGRAAQPLVSGSRIYPVEILLPEAELQSKFEDALHSVARQSEQLNYSKTGLQSLFASLQHRAFSGQM